MPIPPLHEQQARLGRARGGWPEVPFSVVAALAAIAALAVFFWFGNSDPQVSATLREIWAGQQEATIGIEAINDRLAAERSDLKMLSDQFLTQTSGKKAINNSPAAEDQIVALAARLTTLQNAVTRILRDNAEIAERLKETQAQMAQDNASVAEQLKALTQMARDNASAAEQLEGTHEHMAGVFAKADEGLRPQAPLPQPSGTPAIPKRRKIVMRNWF
jgi:septal ring factor EnvC (AmiA/AmiB activator)